MNWEDEGYVISKRKFSENAIILEVFTNNFGKVGGIVYGGNSRKIKNFLQLTNKIYVIYNSKGDNKPGYFKTELINAISPEYFDDKIKTLCLNSISSLLKSVLPENQPYKSIYKSLNELLINFKRQNWLISYINWEINLINNLGFGFKIDVSKYKNSENKETIDINLDNISYKVPSFVIFNNSINLTKRDIYNGLCFTRTLMENKFFGPNNIKFPYLRKLLENKFY